MGNVQRAVLASGARRSGGGERLGTMFAPAVALVFAGVILVDRARKAC